MYYKVLLFIAMRLETFWKNYFTSPFFFQVNFISYFFLICELTYPFCSSKVTSNTNFVLKNGLLEMHTVSLVSMQWRNGITSKLRGGLSLKFPFMDGRECVHGFSVIWTRGFVATISLQSHLNEVLQCTFQSRVPKSKRYVSDGALQAFFFAKLGLTFAYLCVNPASMLIS